MTAMTVRPARRDEAQALSALCKRSKAHWGYDAAFMALSDAALTVSPDLIEAGRVLVAVDGDDVPLGIASLDPLEDGSFELLHLFVDPGAIGRGVGRQLFDAVMRMAKALGATRVEILSDVHAEDFYRRMGARKIGSAPSDAIPGRTLPLLEFTID